MLMINLKLYKIRIISNYYYSFIYSSKLMLLKKALDPNDTDPMVDHITFFNVMSEWTSKVLTDSPELDCKRHGVVRYPPIIAALKL